VFFKKSIHKLFPAAAFISLSFICSPPGAAAESAGSSRENPNPGVVSARKFVLVDENGIARAEIALGPMGNIVIGVLNRKGERIKTVSLKLDEESEIILPGKSEGETSGAPVKSSEEERAILEKTLQVAERAFAAGKHQEVRRAYEGFFQGHPSSKYLPGIAKKLVDLSAKLTLQEKGDPIALKLEVLNYLKLAWRLDRGNQLVKSRMIGLGLLWKDSEWIRQDLYARRNGYVKNHRGLWCRIQPCPRCKDSGSPRMGHVKCPKSGTWTVAKQTQGRIKVYRNVSCETLSKYSGNRNCKICNGEGWITCDLCNGRGRDLLPVDWEAECDR